PELAGTAVVGTIEKRSTNEDVHLAEPCLAQPGFQSLNSLGLVGDDGDAEAFGITAGVGRLLAGLAGGQRRGDTGRGADGADVDLNGKARRIDAQALETIAQRT